jgi:hypothetical protein
MTFRQIIITIVVAILGIVAVRFSFSFDINKYLEWKKQDIKNKIKNHCTHIHVENYGEKSAVQSAFFSPIWTTNRICQRCWLVVNYIDQNAEETRIKKLLQDPDEYKKQEKKFQKLLKKGWFI